MPPSLNLVMRVGCLLIYAVALASLFGWIPADPWQRAQTVAAALLAIHALEVVFMFRHVRLYPGSLGASIALTLLFGLLHWQPLVAAQRRGQGE